MRDRQWAIDQALDRLPTSHLFAEMPPMYEVNYEMHGAVESRDDGSSHLGDSALSLATGVFYVLVLLVYSGNPAPGRMLPLEPQLAGLFLFLAMMVMRRGGCIVSREFVGIALVFAVLLMIQCIDFGFFPVVTTAGFFIRLFIGYAIITLVDDFLTVYVRTMVGLSLLSLCVYLPYVVLSSIGFNFEPFITRLTVLLHTAEIDVFSISRPPLLVHTFYGEFSWRNSGMFWEPGAFQGYLVVALCFLALLKTRLDPRQYRRYFLILFLTVCSTMSTTGYIALAIVILLHFDWCAESRKKLQACILLGCYVLIPLLLSVSLLAYDNLPFLGQKIESQLNALELRQGRWHRGRIGSLVFDWEYIRERPLSGWGLHNRTRYALHPWMEGSEGMGNGFSDFIAKFGVLGFLAWYIPTVRKVHYMGNGMPTLLVGVLLVLLLQGECFLAYPFFLGLPFVGKPSDGISGSDSALWDPVSGDDSIYEAY